MKIIVASIACIVAALAGLAVLRFWVLRDSAAFAAAITQEAEGRRTEQKRQKVRDWLAAADELQMMAELMRRQNQPFRLSVYELPSIDEIEINSDAPPRWVFGYSLEPCALWQRQMEKLREELGLPPLPVWN